MAIRIHPYWRDAVQEARKERSQHPQKPPPHNRSNDRHIQRSSFVVHPTEINRYSFDDGRSAVLGLPTVFNPFHPSHAVAGWPCPNEQQYEGDGRIATDLLHRRFPAVPRVPGNATVNWQQRKAIEAWPLENFWESRSNDVEIMMRSHYIPGIEFTDDQGVEAIGQELMSLLDDKDAQEDTNEDLLSSSAPPTSQRFDRPIVQLFESNNNVDQFNPRSHAYAPPFPNEFPNGVGQFPSDNDRGAWRQAQGQRYLSTQTTNELAAMLAQNNLRGPSRTGTPNWDQVAEFRNRFARPAP
ncbi:hypothetical protein BST61_g4560 [Cercospora zeina]